jgi:hypothetical protein
VLSRRDGGPPRDQLKEIHLATFATKNPGTFSSFLPQLQLSARTRSAIRAAMFVYLGLALCPIEYWPLAGNIDNTWIFALNYARSHHLVIGRDIFWTWGPLSYLALPMNVGSNFVPAIAFQALAWLMSMLVLWELFYQSKLPLKNLVLFSVLLGLSATVSGADQVLLRAALILLILYQLGGRITRYVAALAILGFLPLIKFTWLMVAAGAALGLAVYPILSRRANAWRDAILAVVVPLCVSGIGLWLTLGSLHALAVFMKTSMELSSAFNLAMSLWGAPTELLAAVEALILLAIALAALGSSDRKMSLFLILVLSVPLFVSFKHGFVRQDGHIHHYFCFVALAIGLTTLITPLARERTAVIFAVITMLMVLIWQDNVARTGPRFALMSTGLKTPLNLWNVLHHGREQELLRPGQSALPHEHTIEPEIVSIVQREPIASLSETYTNVYASGLNLVLYPIIQRYQASTLYLDELNAAWVRDRGPRFLIFDGKSIDGRHPWTETPAMWLEVYRWYDTRLLGPRNLLLERRTTPRFVRLEPVAHLLLPRGEELLLPSPNSTSQPIFWSMDCSLSTAGKLRALLFRVLEVNITVDKGERSDVFRVALADLAAPSPGRHLPSNLEEFASLFAGSDDHSFAVKKLKLGGPGASAYEPVCPVSFSVPVP